MADGIFSPIKKERLTYVFRNVYQRRMKLSRLKKGGLKNG